MTPDQERWELLQELDELTLPGWPESWDDSMLHMVWIGGARLLRPITDVETGGLL